MYKDLDQKRYIEQWERVNRWYKTVQKIKAGEIDTSEPKILLDFVYSFFMNCYHLKDWVKNENNNLKNKVEELFNRESGAQSMKICADIANGVKHFSFDTNRRFLNSSASISGQTNQSVTINLNNNKTFYSWEINGFNYFDLAQNCMIEWEKFLKENNLI